MDSKDNVEILEVCVDSDKRNTSPRSSDIHVQRVEKIVGILLVKQVGLRAFKSQNMI